jgi:Domain of unknown function (DUF4292)
MTYKILCLAILLMLFSCKTASNAVKTDTTTPVIVKTENIAYTQLLSEIQKPQSFESVKISSKITVEMDKFVPALDAQFYIENKQKIWLNVSAFFMNFARALCTKEGLKAYEKVGSTYINSDYQFVNDLLNVNFIDYQVLQNILLGRSFLPINEANYNFSISQSGYQLQSKTPQKIEVKGKSTALDVKILFGTDFQLLNIEVLEANTPNVLSIDYQNWVVQQNESWPKSVKISIKNDKNRLIKIENTKFEFLKMETPYAVPNGYTKRAI